MANYRPLVIVAGVIRQLLDTDTLYTKAMQVDTESITATLVGQWNTAYGWGDHSGLYQPVDADLTAIAALTATGGWAKRTAANTWSIATPTAADVGADAAGTAASEVDAHELAFNHANFATAYSWGDHAGLYQPIDSDLTAIAALTATGGYAKRTAVNTWSIATPSAADVGADAAGTAASVVATHTSTYIHVAAPTADNQILQATGIGTAAWTTDVQSLTRLVVDNLTIDGNSIDSNTGILTTNGRLQVGSYTGYDTQLSVNGDISSSGLCIGILINGTYSSDTNHVYAFYLGASLAPANGKQARAYELAVTAVTISGETYPWCIGQHIGTTAKTGTGTITNFAGLYVDPQNIATNNYSIVCINHIWIANDNQMIIFGTGGNSSIYYDGTDLCMNPKLVGSGKVHILGGLVVDEGVDITGNLTVNGIDVTTGITVDGGDVPHITGGNKDIYVATTGNDTTGTGLVGAPYLTVGRAILEVFKLVPSGDDATAEYAITIHVAAGHYAVASALFPTYAYGASLFVEGEIQDCDASTATSYSADTAIVSGLSYVSVTGTLAAGTTAAIGDYLVVKAATGGTNPHLVEGCHEITAWNSGTRVYTAKVIRRAGVAALPAGTITLTTAYVSKTVLTFASGSGIKVQGSYFGGTWNKMTLVGNDSGNGVWCLNNGGIGLGAYFSTSHWGNSLYSQNNALIYADYSTHSYALSNLVRAQNGAVVNVRLGCNLTGAKTYGIYCFIGSSVAASTARMSTTGGTACIECESGSFVDASSSIIKDPHADAEYGNATMGGGINLTGATVSGGQTATADDDSFITGP